jgi:hypothetical protein
MALRYGALDLNLSLRLNELFFWLILLSENVGVKFPLLYLFAHALFFLQILQELKT